MDGNSKWILSLIGLFILIAASIGGYAIARVDIVQNTLRTEYVQKEGYRVDIADLKHSLETLNKKMDRVLEFRPNRDYVRPEEDK